MINKNSKIYMMGSLFNEADVNQRKLEEIKLRSLGYDNIYNPINAPCNDKSKLPTAKDIFLQDTEKVLESDVIVGDISRSDDPGVFTELGIVYMCNYINQLKEEGFSPDEIISKIKPKKVITHLSHISKATAHEYKGNHIPVGFNQYMIGCIEEMDGKIKDNFDEVTEEILPKAEDWRYEVFNYHRD